MVGLPYLYLKLYHRFLNEISCFLDLNVICFPVSHKVINIHQNTNKLKLMLLAKCFASTTIVCISSRQN